MVYRNSLLFSTVLTLTCGKTSSLKSLIIRQTHLWVLNNHKTQNSTIDQDAILSLCLVLLLLVKHLVILMEDISPNTFSVKEKQISKITTENLLEFVKETMAVLWSQLGMACVEFVNLMKTCNMLVNVAHNNGLVF